MIISTTNTTAITSPISSIVPTTWGTIFVSSAFDGGLGCYGKDQMTAIFAIDSPSTASYEAMGMRYIIPPLTFFFEPNNLCPQKIRFTMTWRSNYTTVAVSDTVHTCAPQASKYMTSVLPNSVSSLLLTFSVSLLMFFFFSEIGCLDKPIHIAADFSHLRNCCFFHLYCCWFA